MDRMDRMKASDECGMMSDEWKTAGSSAFSIPHSSLIISSYPVYPC
jgi:hypothetical protein